MMMNTMIMVDKIYDSTMEQLLFLSGLSFDQIQGI